MKKKLLVIVLVFCCVWGVFASKLTDAAKSGDFDTMKKQIELLDYDVNGDSELLKMCLQYWPIYHYGKDEMYKKCIDYLMERGAVIDYVDESFSSYYFDRFDNEGWIFDKVIYMYDKKYDNVDRKWRKSGGQSEINCLLHSDLSYEGNGPFCFVTAMLMLYNPTITAIDSIYYQLLTGDIQGIKSYLRSGRKVKGEFLLYVNNPEVIELLKAVDSYDLNVSFSGAITPYYINEIVPKYCTHLATKEEIAFMKFITNYNSSMDYQKSIDVVKYFISKGVDLTKRTKLLGSRSDKSDMLFVLPIRLGNIDAFKLLMEASDFTLPIEVSDKSIIGKYTVTPKFLYFNEEYGKYWAHSYVNKNDYNALITVFNEISIKKAEKAEEEARIAREKAEEERIAREKKAEADLIANYQSKFCDNVREVLMTYGAVKKDEYKIKSKKFEPLAQKASLYTVYRIDKNYSAVYIEKPIKKGTERIYSFPLSDGYTVENVQKVWNMAVDQICDEYGIK